MNSKTIKQRVDKAFKDRQYDKAIAYLLLLHHEEAEEKKKKEILE
jgi:hypothetical protein